MRNFLIILALAGLSACAVQDSRNQDIRLEEPYVFNRQQWHIVDQKEAGPGQRLCTVASGELQVTQRSYPGAPVEWQVANANHLDVGDHYKVIIKNRIYETPESWYGPKASEDIINELMKNDSVYTELREPVVGYGHGGQRYRTATNQISSVGFPEAFRECAHFIKP